MHYSEVMRWVKFSNLANGYDIVNASEIFDLAGRFEQGKNKNSFFMVLQDYIQEKKIRLKEENPLKEVVVDRSELFEVRIVIPDADATPSEIYPEDLNIGWKSIEYKKVLNRISVLHGYIANRKVFNNFLIKIQKWYLSYRLILEIKKDLVRFFKEKDKVEVNECNEEKDLIRFEKALELLESIQKKISVISE